MRPSDNPNNPGTLVTGDVGHFISLWTAVTASVFSFVGFEAIAVTAPENRDLEKHETIKLATKKLSIRISILYILGTFVGGLNVPCKWQRRAY